jgi:hypothetical protein
MLGMVILGAGVALALTAAGTMPAAARGAVPAAAFGGARRLTA